MNTLIRIGLAIHRLIYRLSGGRLLGSMPGGMEVLILKTIGRKSGKTHEIPISFLREGDAYVLVGSNGGKPQNPGWWHNLVAKPNATVEIKGRTIPVTFQPATAEESDRMWGLLPKLYADYRTKTARTIPFAILTPSPAA